MKSSLLPLSLAGPGNQFCGIKEGLIIAHILNLPMIVPSVIPHFTTRTKSRASYSFEDTFDFDFFVDNCSSMLNVNILSSEFASEISRRLVLMRSDELSTKQALEYYNYFADAMNLVDSADHLNSRDNGCGFLRTQSDVHQFAAKHFMDDSHTSLIGIFNSIKLGGIKLGDDLSICAKNHCLNCGPSEEFSGIYSKVQATFRFSRWIRDFGDRYIERIFDGRPFNAFHLRICDVPRGRKFEDCYSGFTENQVVDILMNLQEEDQLRSSDIFIASPPQLFDKVSGLTKLLDRPFNFFSSSSLDAYQSSLVEQYICTKSHRFVRSYTNTPDQPRKAHTRSSWAELVEGMRIADLGERASIAFDDLVHSFGD